MSDTIETASILEKIEQRRTQRRQFLRYAGGATVAAGGLSLLSACNNYDTPTPAPTPAPTPTPPATGGAAPTDPDILNFALNLEYLEAQFYSYAAFGQGLPADMLDGTVGTRGEVSTSGSAPPRAVNFTDPVVAQYAREIAYDEIAHVRFLRAALGSARIAQPAINLSGDATGAFTVAARAAGVVDSMTGTFDPYSSDNFFLLGAFIFEDVGVTAYKGGSPLITSPLYLEAAAGILAAEAYHAGLVRTLLYSRGVATPALRTYAGQISDLRDALDGTVTGGGIVGDDDQGIVGSATVSNIVPTDANSIAYSRNTKQVHNIVYGSASAPTKGLFFPNGTNNGNPALTVGGMFPTAPAA